MSFKTDALREKIDTTSTSDLFGDFTKVQAEIALLQIERIEDLLGVLEKLNDNLFWAADTLAYIQRNTR